MNSEQEIQTIKIEGLPTVSNLRSQHGNDVPNQIVIVIDGQGTYFQSYRTIIVARHAGKVYLNASYWDYSKTTGKYRNQFLRETKKETEAKIKSGEYQLAYFVR